MAETAKLRDMLQDIINDRPEQAQVNLHDYLVGKMRDIAGTVPAASTEFDVNDDDLDAGTDLEGIGSDELDLDN